MEQLKEGRVAGFPASAPTPPSLTRAGKREAARRDVLHEHAERIERSRQLRGLLWVALLILVGSVIRGGLPNVFPRGWWRLW